MGPVVPAETLEGVKEEGNSPELEVNVRVVPIEEEPTLGEMKAWLKKRGLLGKGRLSEEKLTRRY
jgi:hypothetical protein